MMRVYSVFFLNLAGILLAYGYWQGGQRSRMMSKKTESLNIESKSSWCIIQPEVEVMPGREEVKAGIYLCEGKLTRVVLQSCFRCFDIGRIVPAPHQFWLSPGRYPYQNSSHSIPRYRKLRSAIIT